MGWNNDKSIALSRLCVVLFAAILAIVDIGAYWLVGIYAEKINISGTTEKILLAAMYACSVFGWVVLAMLWKLLGNMLMGEVFTFENTGIMRKVSWCCWCVALICMVSGIVYLPLIVVAAAAAFMGLIVRIVKNAFQQAINMKDELDYTV